MTKFIHFTLICIFISATTYAKTPFAGGNGTTATPYLISNVDELNNVRYFRDRTFALINDIDMRVHPYDTAKLGWQPLFDYNSVSSSSVKINTQQLGKGAYVIEVTTAYETYKKVRIKE